MAIIKREYLAFSPLNALPFCLALFNEKLGRIKEIKENRVRENNVLSFTFIGDGHIKGPIVLNVLVFALFCILLATGLPKLKNGVPESLDSHHLKPYQFNLTSLL